MAPKTRKRKSDQETPTDAGIHAAILTDAKRQRQLPVRAKDEDASSSSTRLAAPAPGSLMVFTDEDDAVAMAPAPAISQPAAPIAEEENDEDEDSDDEAPEAVSTSKAASDIKKSTQAAQKAAKEKAAAQKRKRQERDTRFKQQAEGRKKIDEETRSEATREQDEEATARDPRADVVGRRRRMDKVQVPNLLPAEFLTDSSSEDEEDEVDAGETVRLKKRKVATVERSLTRQGRGPRDERVGSTLYRVVRKADESMAPKLRKHAKGSKDLLLKRNRTAVVPRGGFFVKG